MEIGNDLIASLRSRIGHDGADQAGGHPDWSALLARYAAAHAVRRELLMGQPLAPHLNGSFNRTAAMVLAGDNGQRGVNRTDLVDGKHPGGMDCHTGGETMTGGRGR